MPKLNRIVRIWKRDEFPDSREENRRYWLARSPSERVQAARQLREDTYRQLNGKPLPPMSRQIRPFRLKNS